MWVFVRGGKGRRVKGSGVVAREEDSRSASAAGISGGGGEGSPSWTDTVVGNDGKASEGQFWCRFSGRSCLIFPMSQTKISGGSSMPRPLRSFDDPPNPLSTSSSHPSAFLYPWISFQISAHP